MIWVQVEGLDALMEAFSSLPDRMDAGVMVIGKPAEYALTWEWGSVTIASPGPKTMWSINPAGEQAILTITAPFGYIRINRDRYIEFLNEAFHAIDWGSISIEQLKPKIEQMLDETAVKCAELISATAPIDTGDLRASIIPALVDDPALTYASDYGGQTELDLGVDWIQP